MSITQNYPSIKPSLNLDFANVKALDPRVTFARASTATYYGTQTAKAEENLLIRSQEFDAVWANVRSTDTANADTAPDGTVTADAVLQASGETAAGHVQRSSFPVVAEDYVLSVFAKPNGKNFLRMFENLSDGTSNTTWFNLSTGTVGTTDAGHTATITASTNGYYRCTIKFTVNAARSGTIILGLADTDNSTTVTDSGGLYLWGAQLEQRSAVTAYTPTTTQPITNYIPVLQTAPANVARFDHNPVTGESLGLLVEEQRTNLLVRSEELDNAAWTATNVTVVANSAIAPDGTLTAEKATITNTASNNFFQYATGAYAGQTLTVSFYGKADSAMTLQSHLTDGVAGESFYPSLTTTWQRFTYTMLQSVASTGSGFFISLSTNSTTPFYIWGVQLEVGAFPTSYTKTVASQVTRSAETRNLVGQGQLGEGTFYVEADVVSGNNLITSGTTTFAATATANQKTAVAYDATDTRKSINGATVTSSTGTQGGSDIAIAAGANGHIKKVALYPRKLSDANIAALTS